MLESRQVGSNGHAQLPLGFPQWALGFPQWALGFGLYGISLIFPGFVDLQARFAYFLRFRGVNVSH